MITLGTAIWIGRSSPSLAAANQLIAQAYTVKRPIELRFPGASYGPLRQQRGVHNSRMDEPPELLDAEMQVARGLARHPQDAGWLQAKARTDLLEGNYETAIKDLQRVTVARPDDDVSLKVDLATAYFGLAGTRLDPAEQAADYTLAVKFLNDVLAKSPDDPTALFNRAVVYQRLQKYPAANADWSHYLRLDETGGWAQEAKRHVDETRP
jgi:tetratricopeptide (TPR) repeat protein